MSETKPRASSIFDFLPPLPFFKSVEPPAHEESLPPAEELVEEPTGHVLYRVYERLTSAQEPKLTPQQIRAATTPTHPPPRYADDRKAAANSMSMPNSQEKTLTQYRRVKESAAQIPCEEITSTARYNRNSSRNLAALKKRFESLPESAFQNSSRIKTQGREPRSFG